MGLTGYVELKASKVTDTIDIAASFDDTEEHYVEYSILLKNITNGEEEYLVEVSLDTDTDIEAEILQAGLVVTDQTITLMPLSQQEVTVRVTADEHQPMGDYDVTFIVKDETGIDELNSTVLTTTVKQYYNIKMETLESETYARLIDPNNMVSDPQTESFLVTLENYGNGLDTISLEWVENRDSPSAIPLAWEDTLVEIYEKDGGASTIDEIDVDAYDKITGTPGTVTLEVKVNIPQEEAEGRYWIDIIATSSAPRTYINNLQREDFEIEANATFQIQMILPELKFDTENSYLQKDNQRILDIDTIFAQEIVEVSVIITNTGTAPANDVTIEFSVTLDNIPAKTEEKTITVDPGEDVNITWAFDTTTKGMYFFKVRIDPNNEILGDSPQDNTWNQYLSVKEVPPKDEDKDGIRFLYNRGRRTFHNCFGSDRGYYSHYHRGSARIVLLRFPKESGG
jgi:hypothetical protein